MEGFLFCLGGCGCLSLFVQVGITFQLACHLVKQQIQSYEIQVDRPNLTKLSKACFLPADGRLCGTLQSSPLGLK